MSALIEDLKYEDFKEIAEIVPKKMTMKQMVKCAREIGEKFSLPIMDAKAALFIAFTIVDEQSITCYEQAKSRRVAEVIAQR
jgi:hypothetical protein